FVRVAVIAVCVFAVGVYTDANTLSLHDALPICVDVDPEPEPAPARDRARPSGPDTVRVRRAIGDGHARRGRRARLRRDASVRAGDRKSTRLNSSHVKISYAVFCSKKKTKSNTKE